MEDHKWRGAERAERQRSRRALPPPAGGGRIDRPMSSPAADLNVETTRRELQSRVFGFVSRRVRSREDAEDIAQEVMLRIHRHSADLEHAERMGAWVHRIAANAIAQVHDSECVRVGGVVGFDRVEVARDQQDGTSGRRLPHASLLPQW